MMVCLEPLLNKRNIDIGTEINSVTGLVSAAKEKVIPDSQKRFRNNKNVPRVRKKTSKVSLITKLLNRILGMSIAKNRAAINPAFSPKSR